MKLLLTILFVLLVSKFTKVKASYGLPPVPLPVYFNCFAKHYREVGRKLSEPLTMGIIEVFQDICRYPDALIECVARDVPKSDMVGDILLNTVLDIGDPNRVKKVLGITCKQMSSITNQDLLTAARCLHQNSTVNTFEHTCGSSIETVKRLANIKSMPSDTQSLCRVPDAYACFAKYYEEIGKEPSEPTFTGRMGFIEVFQDICRSPGSTAECVAKDVPTSKHLADLLLNTLLEIDDPNRLNIVLKITCEEMSSITKQDILTATTCLIQNSTVNTLESTCGSTIEAAKGLAKIKSMPSDIRSLCRPLKDVLMCVTMASDDACDQKLSHIARNFALELLKLNCGGERPLTGGKESNSLDFTMVHYVLQLAFSAFRFFV